MATRDATVRLPVEMQFSNRIGSIDLNPFSNLLVVSICQGSRAEDSAAFYYSNPRFGGFGFETPIYSNVLESRRLLNNNFKAF